MNLAQKAWADISKNEPDQPSWKHRRRLIYGAYILGVFMVVFGIIQFLFDTQAGVQAIVGGVSLITIIVSAYTGFAAWQDTRLFGSTQNYHNDYDRMSDG